MAAWRRAQVRVLAWVRECVCVWERAALTGMHTRTHSKPTRTVKVALGGHCGSAGLKASLPRSLHALLPRLLVRAGLTSRAHPTLLLPLHSSTGRLGGLAN